MLVIQVAMLQIPVTRTVNVVDTTAPVITLLGDNPMTIEVGSTFTDPGATAQMRRWRSYQFYSCHWKC